MNNPGAGAPVAAATASERVLLPVPARRETLVHLLTEAAEIEHNLLCSYLYAAFSLKSGRDDGLSEREARSVAEWRKTVLSVAIEEMGHLALVNNLLVALGGAPQFDRPNLPVPPGYHPAGFVIRLVPLTKATLDHFIYLERPGEAELPDGAGGYRRRVPLRRLATPGDLTPSTPDYETIGEFYAAIRSTLTAFASAHGDSAFLASAQSRQLAREMVDLPGIIVIRTLDDALAALDTIIEQGEGSSCEKENCHFTRFQAMRRQWSALEAANPAFVPHHQAAHDPVMRRPVDGLQRVWITSPPAARLLDLGNALYGVALTLLEQAYALAVPTVSRPRLVESSIGLMHALGTVGSALARMPADEERTVNAGLTFAVPRNLHDVPPDDLVRVLSERLDVLGAAAEALDMSTVATAIARAATTLRGADTPK